MLRTNSIPAKVLNVLTSGKKITPSQITRRFGAANPHDAVYVLESHGIRVNRSYRRIRGIDYVTYSMGNETAAV